ncbi:TetR/AcrR family transcriptional regulator [Streptomyces sp. tea 10]|nr:TetR/AcrR family transcriptional regulator [Streptomyces sp. tea 10]
MAASMRGQLKQATQLRVLEAASRLFQERGFTATTVRDIAEAADVSAGTVMTVGDKNALLVRVFDAMVAGEHARRADVCPQSAGDAPDTCVRRLSVLVQPFVAMFTGRPELARLYASILVSGTQSSSLFTELAARLVDEFAAAITEHGCTSQADAPAKAQALYAAYVGTLFTWSALGLIDPSGLTNNLGTSFAAICTCKE